MLKTIDEQELAALIAAEQSIYINRKSGIDLYFSTDPETGRPIPKQVDGALEVFFCPTPLDILPTYLDAIERGYTPHPLSVVVIDQLRHDLYMVKPDEVQKVELDRIAGDVTARYHQDIAAHNEAFIQLQVDAQLRVDAAREEREQAKAEAEKRAAVEKQIRETFAVQPPVEVAPDVAKKGPSSSRDKREQ